MRQLVIFIAVATTLIVSVTSTGQNYDRPSGKKFFRKSVISKHAEEKISDSFSYHIWDSLKYHPVAVDEYVRTIVPKNLMRKPVKLASLLSRKWRSQLTGSGVPMDLIEEYHQTFKASRMFVYGVQEPFLNIRDSIPFYLSLTPDYEFDETKLGAEYGYYLVVQSFTNSPPEVYIIYQATKKVLELSPVERPAISHIWLKADVLPDSSGLKIIHNAGPGRYLPNKPGSIILR